MDPDIYGRIKPFVLDGFLTPYQLVGWAFSAARGGSMLWWACGSGKTLAALLWVASKKSPRASGHRDPRSRTQPVGP